MRALYSVSVVNAEFPAELEKGELNMWGRQPDATASQIVTSAGHVQHQSSVGDCRGDEDSTTWILHEVACLLGKQPCVVSAHLEFTPLGPARQVK